MHTENAIALHGIPINILLFKAMIISTKKQLSIVIVGSALIAWGTGEAAHAALLGRENFEVGIGINDFPVDNFEVNLKIAPGSSPTNKYPSDSLSSTIFKGTIISLANVGQTYTATQTTDTAFNDFATRLTNGETNLITLILGQPDLEIPREGYATLYNGKNISGFGDYSDLSGSTIDSIDLMINSLTVASTDAGKQSFGGSFTLSVYGQPSQSVPESDSALSVLAFGALGAGLLLKRKQQQKAQNRE